MTQSVAATRNANGIANRAIGAITGDGTLVTVTLGFKPMSVRLVNLTDATVWEKIDGMGATQTMKTVTAGTLTTDTSSAIVLTANGFTVSAAAAANAKSLVFYAD